MNTHTLTYIALLVINNQLPQETLCIWMFNSQICKSMFRAARSMMRSFSSVINFSVVDFPCCLFLVKTNGNQWFGQRSPIETV